MALVNVFWFRRDLRLHDNHGLQVALTSGRPVVPVFIFDDRILKPLSKSDARVEFIVKSLASLNSEIQEAGGTLHVFYGDPVELWPQILRKLNVGDVFCNEDYEPYAIYRDSVVAKMVEKNGGEFRSFKDQVIFAKDEVVKEGGDPYRVYTPYCRAWRKKIERKSFVAYKSEQYLKNFKAESPQKDFSLKDLGFRPSGISFPSKTVKKAVFSNYGKSRDLMGVDATSHLGVHLRFGTISIRQLARVAREASDVYLSELIWREFFMQILFHFPSTVSEPFNPRYKNVRWRNSKDEFKRWCEGQTGYPIVDAGMRELNATGFMHNRARMITASFLTKHLLVDWRWGERYFAEKLLDFELAANVGNWQWVAGCGCDAAPYFRVFNPMLQAKKFDVNGAYVKKWVPELGTSSYPEPMVDHELARRRVLAEFKKALGSGGA